MAIFVQIPIIRNYFSQIRDRVTGSRRRDPSVLGLPVVGIQRH
jgi:hypothetical protein